MKRTKKKWKFVGPTDEGGYRQIQRIGSSQLGGWLQCEDGLSHDGNCWVSQGCYVQAGASIRGDATIGMDGDNVRIRGGAQVFGNASIRKNAQVCDDAQVGGHAIVAGSAIVRDWAKVFGTSRVIGSSIIMGNAEVYENAKISDQAVISGNATVRGSAEVGGNVVVSGRAIVENAASLCSREKITGNVVVCYRDDVIYIGGFTYPVTFYTRLDQVTIGCTTNTIDGWRKDKRIKEFPKLAKVLRALVNIYHKKPRADKS